MGAVILAVAASIFWGMGTSLQKHGMSTSFPKIGLSALIRDLGRVFKVMLANKPWMLGFLCMAAGTACFSTALGQGDLALVQPIVGLTGVFAALIGVTFLRERFRTVEWIGIGLIVAGAVAVGAAVGEQSARMPSAIALIVASGLCVAGTGAGMAARRFGIAAEFSYSVAAGVVFGLSNFMGKLMTQRTILDVGEPFSYGRPEVLGSILTDFPFLVVLGCTVVGGILINAAYADGRVGVTASVVTIVSAVIPIIAALTIFGERVVPLQIAGIVIVVAGTAMLARRDETPAQSATHGTR